MRTIALILALILLVGLSCRKKEIKPAPNPNTTGSTTSTTTTPTPVDTIPRVSKTLSVYLKDYYDRFTEIYLKMGDKPGVIDSTVHYQTGDTLTRKFSTKLRYIKYEFYSSRNQLSGGQYVHVPGDFYIKSGATVLVAQDSVKTAYGNLDLYQ